MSKKKLNSNDFEDFFSSQNTIEKIQNPEKRKPAETQVETIKNEDETIQKNSEIEKSINLSKTKNGKRPKALSKNDKYSDKNVFKGLYLTDTLAKQLEGVGGLVGRTHSDLICEALEKFFSTKKYEEITTIISRIG